VTVICPLANSYLQSATACAGAVTELAATRKVAKYSALEDQYIFQPVAVKSFGPMKCDARKFLADVGRRISRVWRRQGNHIFVSTHFCFVISFQFCFVAQQF